MLVALMRFLDYFLGKVELYSIVQPITPSSGGKEVIESDQKVIGLGCRWNKQN